MTGNPAAIESFAASLFELASAIGAVERIEKDLVGFLDLIEESQPLRRFLGDPALTEEGKIEGLRQLGAGRVHPALLHFLLVLARERQLENLKAIVEAFVRRRAGSQQTVWGELVGAIPVDDSQVKVIEQEMSRRLNKPVRLRMRVNPNVLGGVAVNVGHFSIDGTIRGRLDAIARVLAG